MKGIVLAGGTGSRLWPITRSVSKQLLPVYDKPMIYYPVSTLMLAGVREILIITTPQDQALFINLLGDGSKFGVSFTYSAQQEPKGIAESFLIAENFLAGESCLLILGDNIFHGADLGLRLISTLPKKGAHIFTYEVKNPSEYGVLEIDSNHFPKSIREKPTEFISNLAVTGLYFFDENVVTYAKNVKPSARGELEITEVIGQYLKEGKLTYTKLSRGNVWLDTGNPDALNDAANYVKVIEDRSGLKIACLEEIALTQGWIDKVQIKILIEELGRNSYSNYLSILL